MGVSAHREIAVQVDVSYVDPSKHFRERVSAKLSGDGVSRYVRSATVRKAYPTDVLAFGVSRDGRSENVEIQLGPTDVLAEYVLVELYVLRRAHGGRPTVVPKVVVGTSRISVRRSRSKGSVFAGEREVRDEFAQYRIGSEDVGSG